MTPLSDVLAAVMLVVAVYCVGRLLLSFGARRATQRDADLIHVVMGVSMAGMLAPSLAAGPTDLWLLVFSGSTAWFGWRVLRASDRDVVGNHSLGQHMPHLLMSGAMVYMLVVAAWTGSMGAMHSLGLAGMRMDMGGAGAARWPLPTIALAAVLFGDGAFTFGRSLRRVSPILPSLATASVPASVPASAAAFVPDRSWVPQRAARPASAAPVAAEAVVAEAVAGGAAVLAPRSAMVCQLVMSLVMGYMLVSLL